VRDGMAVLAGLIAHTVEQVHGGDHPRQGDSEAPSAAGG
jgi:hypothetical protein